MKKIKNNLDLSIIIPAFNEEKKIALDIDKAFEFLAKNSLSGEVIVSTDGVTDRTNEIVKEIMKAYPLLQLISRSKKIGKGGAIKLAVIRACGEVIMYADAGLCVDYKHALEGMSLIKNGADIAIASREHDKSRVILAQPLYRKVGSKVFALGIHKILGIDQKITDTQCGFKLFRNSVAKKIFSRTQTAGFMIDIEVLLWAKKLGVKVESFAVTWRNDPDTKFNPLNGTVVDFKELWEIKFRQKL